MKTEGKQMVTGSRQHLEYRAAVAYMMMAEVLKSSGVPGPEVVNIMTQISRALRDAGLDDGVILGAVEATLGVVLK